METIKLGGVELRDNRTAPLMMAVTPTKGTFVWTHLCGDVDRISPRRFNTEAEAREYVMALCEKLEDFSIEVENLVQNYKTGEAIVTERTTIIDV